MTEVIWLNLEENTFSDQGDTNGDNVVSIDQELCCNNDLTESRASL